MQVAAYAAHLKATKYPVIFGLPALQKFGHLRGQYNQNSYIWVHIFCGAGGMEPGRLGNWSWLAKWIRTPREYSYRLLSEKITYISCHFLDFLH